MGLMKQFGRAIRDLLDDFSGIFKRKKKRGSVETVRIHRSWKHPEDTATKKRSEVKIIKQQKIRIPGLRQFKRILAGFLLLINFTFSQFLLGSIGAQAQPMFLIFIGNSLILVDYLWKTRKKTT